MPPSPRTGSGDATCRPPRPESRAWAAAERPARAQRRAGTGPDAAGATGCRAGGRRCSSSPVRCRRRRSPRRRHRDRARCGARGFASAECSGISVTLVLSRSPTPYHSGEPPGRTVGAASSRTSPTIDATADDSELPTMPIASASRAGDDGPIDRPLCTYAQPGTRARLACTLDVVPPCAATTVPTYDFVRPFTKRRVTGCLRCRRSMLRACSAHTPHERTRHRSRTERARRSR